MSTYTSVCPRTSVGMSTASSATLTQEPTRLAHPALVDFRSQYDGKDGRPAANLVIAWPHGMAVVDAMVEAFQADGNMSVVSLVNAEVHNATALLPCIYATECMGPNSHHDRTLLYGTKFWYRIQNKAVCPFPCNSLGSRPGGTQRDRARLRQLFLERMSNKAIVAMVVVDHMDPNLHNDYTDRMTRVKRQIRAVCSRSSLPPTPTPTPTPRP